MKRRTVNAWKINGTSWSAGINLQIDDYLKRRVIIMSDIKFEIKQEIGILSEGSKGWTKELNLVS